MSATWRKSSYSGNGGQNCVETGDGKSAVLVRDTKDRGRGPVLHFTRDEWQRFTGGIKSKSL